MKELVKTLVTEFGDKEYAHAYMEEFSNMSIAAQIKVLREQRGWTQKELADASGMKQERISTLEDIDYDAWTIKTLRKLSKAFDLTVKLSFETFSSGILNVTKVNAKTLEKTSRQEDLDKFSYDDFGNKEILWGKPVRTVQPNLLHLVQTYDVAVNDTKYCKDRQTA